MKDPIGAHIKLKESVIRYIETAFGSQSTSFENDRKNILGVEEEYLGNRS